MTLVVIDMQPSFDASRCVIKQVVKEVRRAKELRNGIVVVEYAGCGPTHSEIQSALRGYNRQAWVTKDIDDGYREVINIVHQHRFWEKSWRFCGVNTCCCVRDTIKGIIRKYPSARFEYAVEAMSCNCYEPPKCAQYFRFQTGLRKNHRIV